MFPYNSLRLQSLTGLAPPLNHLYSEDRNQAGDTSSVPREVLGTQAEHRKYTGRTRSVSLDKWQRQDGMKVEMSLKQADGTCQLGIELVELRLSYCLQG